MWKSHDYSRDLCGLYCNTLQKTYTDHLEGYCEMYSLVDVIYFNFFFLLCALQNITHKTPLSLVAFSNFYPFSKSPISLFRHASTKDRQIRGRLPPTKYLAAVRFAKPSILVNNPGISSFLF